MDSGIRHRSEEPASAQAGPPPAPPRRRISGLLCLTAAGAGLGLCSLAPRPPALIWNFTESVPVGLYRLDPHTPRIGDIIAVAPAAAARHALDQSGALPAGRLLLKQVAGLAGDTVCRTGSAVSINNAIVANARTVSAGGRALPVWEGCRTLGPGEAFALSPHPLSFDGRYLGPVAASEIAGVAHPLITLPSQEAR